MIELSHLEFAYLIWAWKNSGKISGVGGYAKGRWLVNFFIRMKDLGLVYFDDIAYNIIERGRGKCVFEIVMKEFRIRDFEILDVGKKVRIKTL